jgi:uncharacterized protein YecE (DUF72 family)
MDKTIDKIFIGISGYKHTDWSGNVYPFSLKPIDYLSYYINQLNLNFLELTFTFHKIPYAKTSEQIVEHIKKENKSFRVSIKLHKSLLRPVLESSVLNEYLSGLTPFFKENIPVIFLADYPIEFTASKKNLRALISLKKSFKDYILFVSLPHRSWYKERYIEIFRENKIGLIIHYIPEHAKGSSPSFVITTNGYAYFRLYSNPTFYLPSSNINILYNYPTKSLDMISKVVSKLSIITQETYVAFCNIKNGIAASNAMLFKKIIEDSIHE